MTVTFNVAEKAKDELQVGDAIEVERNGETFAGTITEVGTMAGPQTLSLIHISRYDVFFWTKQWNMDTIVMLLFFLAAISFLVDFFKYVVAAWLKEIVDDIQILKE